MEFQGCRDEWRSVRAGLVSLLQKFGPSLLEELPHVVSCSADVGVVLVELLAVIENQVDIDDESLQVLISEMKKTFCFRSEEHTSELQSR